MGRKILIGLVLVVSTFIVSYIGLDLYEYYFHPKLLMTIPAPPPVSPMTGIEEIAIEAGPIKVNIGEDTPWQSIAKLLTTVLGAYLGIKLINKYVRV